MARNLIDDDSGWRKLKAELLALERTEVQSGVLGSEASQEHTAGITMVELATIHEFGANGIPERSFIRNGFDKYQEQINNQAQEAISAALDGQNWMMFVTRVGLLTKEGIVNQSFFSKTYWET
jgi:hypothetical protein